MFRMHASPSCTRCGPSHRIRGRDACAAVPIENPSRIQRLVSHKAELRQTIFLKVRLALKLLLGRHLHSYSITTTNHGEILVYPICYILLIDC